MRTNPRSGLGGRLALSLGVAVLAVGLGACGAMKSEAEGVFLQQNQVSSALMQAIMAAEMDDPALADRLYGQEAELQRACGPLQKAGFKTLHDEHVDRNVQYAAFNALHACGQKSNELALLLWQVDPITAQGYLTPVKALERSERPLKAYVPQSLMR